MRGCVNLVLFSSKQASKHAFLLILETTLMLSESGTEFLRTILYHTFTVMQLTLHSAAATLATRVLPVPGGP